MVPMNLRGAEIDVWLDTWQECRKFQTEMEKEAK